MREHCRRLQLPCVGVLDQAMSVLAVHFHSKSEQWPGRQHQLDEGYFDRIDAMHYTLAHDDGQSTHDLDDADVILVGPSRTSKTPTCVYLANRGVRAANVPLVPLVPPPAELERAKRPLIVGLITDPERLVQIRVNRLRLLQQDTETRIHRHGAGAARDPGCAPALCAAQVGDHRRHPPLDRGDGGVDPADAGDAGARQKQQAL